MMSDEQVAMTEKVIDNLMWLAQSHPNHAKVAEFIETSDVMGNIEPYDHVGVMVGVELAINLASSAVKQSMLELDCDVERMRNMMSTALSEAASVALAHHQRSIEMTPTFQDRLL